MTIETTAVKATQESARQGVRTAETAIKKLWTLLDAAAEKKPPSEYLSPRAVAAIQGKKPG